MLWFKVTTMRSSTSFFLVSRNGSPILLSQSAKPVSPNADTREIQDIEDRWLKAIESSDVTALDPILADDFVRPVAAAGRFINKAQLIDYYKARKPSPGTSSHIEDLDVTRYGDTAIARGRVITSDADGHTVSDRLFTDVFVHRNGRWQAVSAQENEIAKH